MTGTIERSEEERRASLTPDRYRVLRYCINSAALDFDRDEDGGE